MDFLSKDKLIDKVNNIISDYDNFRKGKISRRKLQYSVGYHLSDLRKYELEEGHYASRSICVAPNCSPILDLSLMYNTKKGPAKYVLTIRPEQGDKYIIYKNKLYYLDIDKYSEPFHNTSISFTEKYQTEKSLTSCYLSKIVKKSSSIKESHFYCPTKNTGCCYYKINHSNNCKDCCIDQVHYRD